MNDFSKRKPDAKQDAAEGNNFVGSIRGFFPQAEQRQEKQNTVTTLESRAGDERTFSFPKLPFSKSINDTAATAIAEQPASNETRLSFFRSLWNRTKDPSDETTTSSARQDEYEKQRRDKKQQRFKESKAMQQKQDGNKQQQLSKKLNRNDQVKQEPLLESKDDQPWAFGIFSKIQSAAGGLFNNSSSSNSTTAINSSNETTSGSNPFTSMQRYIASSTASLLASATNNAKNDKEEWVVVLPKTRLMPGVIVPVTVAGGLDLLVVASKDGRRLYAIENSCPHLGTPLETGQLVRLPVEETPMPSSMKAGSSKSLPSQKQQSLDSSSSSFQSKLTGAFNGPWSETEVSKILQQDGCEDCIVCPLHRTAFALQSGAVRGEWCPYPPILGKLIGNVKAPTGVAVFDVRTRGKNVEIRINTPILMEDDDDDDAKR
ncbi:hypothetical protein MPSEU_000944400 [Mayamaea pseudoterrestris]|nr:hypothetical protein MPSEU_000944400 [Mayamaea pseudoterrestris]